MKVSLSGKLIECVSNKSKDGTKSYFSLNLYQSGQMIRVGVPEIVYNSYLGQENENISLTDVSLFVEGKSSLYIKG